MNVDKKLCMILAFVMVIAMSGSAYAASYDTYLKRETANTRKAVR